MSDSDEEKHGILEDMKEALKQDAEVPIDKKAPGSTFALVALSYLAVLTVVAILLAVGIGSYQAITTPDSEVEPKTDMAINRPLE